MSESPVTDRSLQKVLEAYVVSRLPRVLTHLDRDPDSPTYGCFDRAFWHYKTQDFSSAILQQSVLFLHASSTSSLLSLNARTRLSMWAQGAIDFWATLPTTKGGFNEYYPFESGYPPTAFSLHAISIVLPCYRSSRSVQLQIQNAVRYLLNNLESEALNQQAAGLAGLAHCQKLPGIQVDGRQFENITDRFFASQHPEGWFPEYGGPDIGYLSVTIDMLWDYYDATGDERALRAISNSLTYISSFVAPDGSIAGLCNSRNTDYVVPYGLTRSAVDNALAAAILSRVFSNVDSPKHFMASIDDRYHLHYIFNSIVRSLPHISRVSPTSRGLPCDGRSRLYFSGCGNLADHHGDLSIFCSGKRGGLVSILNSQGVCDADYGWRCKLHGRYFVSNFWSNYFTISIDNDTFVVRGPLIPIRWHRPSPTTHFLLRAFGFFLGNRLMRGLKHLMIFRKASSRASIVRSISLQYPLPLEIIDELSASSAMQAWRAERPSARHVSSAGAFGWEELLLKPNGVEKVPKVHRTSRWIGGK